MHCVWLSAVALLVACGGGAAVPTIIDATAGDAPELADAAPPACSCAQSPPPDMSTCETTCGNGVIDPCYDEGVRWSCSCGATIYQRTESCDGEMTPTCGARGYYGATKPCNSACFIDLELCDACGPDVVACATIGHFRLDVVAASGSRLAIIQPHDVIGPPSLIWIVEHVTKQLQHIGWSTVSGIVDVPQGWLVATASPATLYPLDASGTAGTARPIDTGEPAMASEQGGRVIVAWSEGTAPGPLATYFEIVDASGRIVVPRTQLWADGFPRPAVASDGTSFFVAGKGTVAKVRKNGAYAISSGFPGGGTRVTWSGVAGWYLARDTTGSFNAQRFDANGSPIGSLIAVGSAEDFIADGTDLLVLRRLSTKLHLLRIGPDGTVIASKEVGAGNGPARVVRADGRLYVTWNAQVSTLYVAEVAL